MGEIFLEGVPMKNKLFKIILASLPCLSLATGCINKGNGKIKLTIGFWPESTETKDVAMYKTWKENFEKDYPEYEIVASPYTYATDTVGSKYETDSLPTVFQTWFTEPSKLVQKKYIRSIDKQLKDLGWDQKMDSNMKEALTFDDKIYGIPRDGYGLGLLLNIKTLGENGLLEEDGKGSYKIYNDDGTPAYPTTFEEIYEWSKVVAENDEKKGILICSSNKEGGWQFSNIAWNYGANLQYQNEEGKWISNLNCQESVDALSWIQKMKSEDLLVKNPNVTYNEWFNSIESKVAMAIVGSDVLQLAKINGNVNMDDLAFVPMPTGDNIHHYSLYGGTPYVFKASATDEQVEGVLKFFEYIGRTPDVSEISKAAMEQGNIVAQEKGQPILPTIKPWINEEYVSYAKTLEDKYVSVKMENYEEFFNEISKNKHSEVTYGAQEMYGFLDFAIQEVFLHPDTANPLALLTTANANMQKYLDKNINK